MKETLYKCTICKREYPFNQIKYNKEEKIVCKTCAVAKVESKVKIPAIRINENPKNVEQPIMKAEQKKKPVEEIIKYVCTSCKYRFKLGKGSKISKNCPYCGKATVEVDNYDANQIIREASNPRGY